MATADQLERLDAVLESNLKSAKRPHPRNRRGSNSTKAPQPPAQPSPAPAPTPQAKGRPSSSAKPQGPAVTPAAIKPRVGATKPPAAQAKPQTPPPAPVVTIVPYGAFKILSRNKKTGRAYIRYNSSHFHARLVDGNYDAGRLFDGKNFVKTHEFQVDHVALAAEEAIAEKQAEEQRVRELRMKSRSASLTPRLK